MLKLLAETEFMNRWQAQLPDREGIEARVAGILSEIKTGGDQAVARLSREIEGFLPDPVYISRENLARYTRQIPAGLTEALVSAAKRIAEYYRRQMPAETSSLPADAFDGATGWINRPLNRVACYVPGGRSPYPSSVLMTVIPARVAGVKDIVVVTPPRQEGDAAVMAAAYLAGARGVYRLGGAVAVGTMAYGTETIAPVEKIVGPGNAYVETAKRMVAAHVGIDLPAGPSELVLVADESANPHWVAADLLAQAEHSPDAAAALITTAAGLPAAVNNSLKKILPSLSHAAEAEAALSSRSGTVVVPSLEQAIALANRCAPEHLQLFLQDPMPWLEKVENAGAVFLGPLTPVALGDYWAGPSHVLPTGRTARFASPLGVSDFRKRISVVHANQHLLGKAAAAVKTIARREGFEAHALSVELRE